LHDLRYYFSRADYIKFQAEDCFGKGVFAQSLMVKRISVLQYYGDGDCLQDSRYKSAAVDGLERCLFVVFVIRVCEYLSIPDV